MIARAVSARSVAAIFDPERLVLARCSKGWTKAALSKRAEVSAPALSQYERGTHRPGPEVLARLALALGYPIGFFASGRPHAGADVSLSHFRSLRATTQTERRQALSQVAFAWEVARELERHVRFPEVDLPHLDLRTDAGMDEIEEAATEVRRYLDLGAGPVAHMVRLLESRGVLVVRLPGKSERVDAFSQPFPERPIIVLSSIKADKARSRMDAAHELGHLVMHHDAEPGGHTVERQAKQFASALLLPAASIRPCLRTPLRWPDLVTLKVQWGVSLQALLYRARALGVISEATHRRHLITMATEIGPSGEAWRVDEPGDLGEAEQPVMLQRALELAGARGINMDELARRVCLPMTVVQDLVQLDDPRPILGVTD